MTDFQKTGSRIYMKDDFLIEVDIKRIGKLWRKYALKDFLVLELSYAKPKEITKQQNYIEAYFGKNAAVNNSSLTQEEIDRLLNINSAEDKPWKVLEENADRTIWKNTKSYYAMYDKKKMIFSVAKPDKGEKWLYLDDKMRGL
jgi:hypothetical protein